MKVTGTFNGTGAALYVGIGFIPDWVRVRNMEDADVAELEWNRHMLRCAEMPRGRLNYTAAGLLGDPRTVADGGIHIYRGGDVIASASTAYLKRVGDTDRRNSVTYGNITRWTLDTSANRTGHWDLEADTTYIGEGSLVIIKEDVGQAVKQAAVQAMTSNGEATDEVTLSEAVKTGTVQFIGNMYDWAGCSAGDITQAGFLIDATSVINVSGEMCAFEAGTYDE